MATPTDLTPLRNARSAFRTARQALLTALDNVGTAAAALADAQRRFAAGRPELAAAVQANSDAISAAATARANEKTARANVLTAISNWVTGVSIDADLGRLQSATPLVLFPVRIETRFGTDASGNPVLRVRIFPDEIFINLHEPAVTRDEFNAGVAYYKQRDAGGNEGELWRQIIQQMPPERAAYVLRLLTPTFGGGTSGTGGTTSGVTSGGSIGPEFPTGITFKPRDFSRPGEAILPDRWFVRTVSGTTIVDHPGNPIPEPLTATPDPQTKDPSELFQVQGSNPPLLIDDEIAWTVDYQRASDSGMAVTIPLTAAQAAVGTGGFDRIIVFGIKSSLDPNETTTLLEQLFDAHHYTRGLALVPQGTPTNNTEDAPSPLPVEDPDGVVSFAVERQAPPSANTSSQFIFSLDATDGGQLARVLGVHNGLFQNIAGTAGQEQARALQMATLLWPSTFGYFVEQLMHGLFSTTQHNNFRDYFFANVRARGPAPAFRVGQVPYGVIPAVSVVGWQKRGSSVGETIENGLRQTLLLLRETWKSAALSSVPTVLPNSSDPLADLFRILALYPSARELRARHGTGLLTNFNLFNFLGIDFQSAVNEARAIAQDVLGRISQPTWISALIAGMVFGAQPNLVAIPMVAQGDGLAENKLLPSTFANVAATVAGTAANLLNDTVTTDPNVTNTMIYKFARQAILWALTRACITQVQNAGNPFVIAFLEAELILSATGPVPFGPLLVSTTLTPGTALGDSTNVQNDAEVLATRAAVSSLASVSTAELDRLLSETLDLSSHRLDAWLTAFGTRRLLEMRSAQQTSSMAPVGSYLGGYAFVENVRPVARTTSTLAGYGTVETQAGNGGFIQAPSLTHATAAAILRNGYLSYRDENANKYAFDLSSARVRAARSVFEALRAGQPLGAIFGYQFERAVQSYPASLNLNTFRFALRNYFPLVANQAGGTTTVPTATVPSVAARNVVDGLALWRAFQANTIPWDTAPDLPRRTIVVNGQTVANPPFTALTTEISRLGDAIDGVSDLNVGEGVLQLIRANVTNASGNLDALARGARPPDPEMAVSQRGGIPANHRVAMVFSGSGVPTSPGAGWPSTFSPRATVEPVLDSWAGTILGNPTVPKARVTLDPIDPKTATWTTVDFSLADLGLRPLDLIAIARVPAASNAGSILDRRFAAAAAAFLTTSNDTTHQVGAVNYLPAQGPGSIPQFMEVARVLGSVFGGARPLASDDLVSPADAPAARSSTDAANLPLLATLGANADAATAALQGLATSLGGTTGLVAALISAASYFPDAFPPLGATDASLAVSIAPAVASELSRRVAAATAATTPLATTAAGQAGQRLAQLRALFGNEFLALPPVFPPNSAELDQSLGAGTALVPDPNAPAQFLQQAAQVYDGLGRFRRLGLYMGALSRSPLRLDVAQLPFDPADIWIGLPFDSDHLPSPGRQSLLVFSLGTSAPEAANSWQGIVIQDWVEVIPNTTEETGLAINYDNPGAEAPQAVLVVPPSSVGSAWTSGDVWATLAETLDLAKIRAVDLELVGGMGQFLPAIVAPQNLQVQTGGTGFFGQLFNIF
jgi:hypothetical protein